MDRQIAPSLAAPQASTGVDDELLAAVNEAIVSQARGRRTVCADRDALVQGILDQGLKAACASGLLLRNLL